MSRKTLCGLVAIIAFVVFAATQILNLVVGIDFGLWVAVSAPSFIVVLFSAAMWQTLDIDQWIQNDLGPEIEDMVRRRTWWQ